MDFFRHLVFFNKLIFSGGDMKIKTSKDIYSSLDAANFKRYYKESKWHRTGIRTIGETMHENVSKMKKQSGDDQVIHSRTPSDAFNRL